MKRSVIILLILGVAAILIVSFMVFIRPYIPKYSWRVTYKERSEQPYGTAYTYRLMKETGMFKKFDKLDKSFTKSLPATNKKGLYVFIGYLPFYDSLEVERLLKYVAAGNDVLLAAEKIPEELNKKLFNVPDSLARFDYLSDSVITTKFGDSLKGSSFKFHFQFYKHSIPAQWGFFYRHRFQDTTMILPSKILSTIGPDKVNFWKARYGKGAIYVLTDPLLLTNYYMVTEKGYRYLNTLFSIIGPHEVCYWDEYSKLWNYSQGAGTFTRSPLKFILSQPSLRLAYYLTLALILIYLIAKARRIQRPIPIQSENRNTSIRFAEAVGALHYQNSNHDQLARQMMGLFLSFVRQRYNISTNLDESDLIIQITRHSEVEKARIERIFKQVFSIKYNPHPDKIETIRLHSYLEYFYKNCK